MSKFVPPKRAFPRIAEAREILKARALEITRLYIQNAKLAMKKGDHATAQSSFEFLMKHMPPDEIGKTLLSTSIDAKGAVSEIAAGPTIQIGFALGGVQAPAALPPAPIEPIIDAEPTADPEAPRCARTSNLCGTDTWPTMWTKNGPECCSNCFRYWKTQHDQPR